MRNKYPNPYQTFSGKPLPQREYEFTKFMGIIKQHDCHSILEIGSRYGDSVHRIANTCFNKKDKIRIIELPNGPWGNNKSLHLLQNCIKDLKSSKYDCGLFLGDSTSSDSIKYGNDNGPYDIVFIDGDHTYEGVKKDFYNYKHLATKLIVFHDIDKEGQLLNNDDTVGVGIFWEEIKDQCNYIELICPHQRGMGIGILIL